MHSYTMDIVASEQLLVKRLRGVSALLAISYHIA
jgi:hypothetical protein